MTCRAAVGEIETFDRRAALFGVFWWVLFAVVVVVVRGVRWEESHEFAQILLGLIHYPEGHPAYQYVHHSFSLQTYITAALMWFTPNPALVCGFRNVLYVIAKTLPFYLFGTLLSRKPVAGHIAALLALLTTEAFTNAYPSYMWPVMSTNGVVGLGFALAALCLLAMEWPRTAYFMIGLMPAVHIGQFPPLFLVACIYLVYTWHRDRRYVLRHILPGLASGLALTAATVIVYLFVATPTPTNGPYFADIPWKSVWQGFMSTYAFHRGVHFGEDQIVLAWMVLLGGGAVALKWKSGKRGAWFWIALYGWVLSLTVWAIMGVHYVMGDRIPPWFINWMPYRLPNHLVPLLAAMMTALIAGEPRARGLNILLLAAPVAAVFGLSANMVFLGVCGVATHAVTLRLRPERNRVLLWGLLAAIGCLLLWRYFGDYALYALGGWFAALLATWTDRFHIPARFPQSWRSAPAVVCLIVVLVILWGQWRQSNLPESVLERLLPTPFEVAVGAYLREHGAVNEMIAVPPFLWRLQARLGCAVTTDAATLSWIPYCQSIAPSLWKLYKDLYDIDLSSTDKQRASDWVVHYQKTWEDRQVEEWQKLGRKYAIHYVIAPARGNLKLPLAVDGKPLAMYSIP